MQVAYTVRATFPDLATADEYIGWLTGGHIAQVLAAGASGATLVRLDGQPPRVEVRYRFPTRGIFDRYEREHAPALRADGAARFGGRNVSFERTLGAIIPLPGP